jgi:hypothetical protein
VKCVEVTSRLDWLEIPVLFGMQFGIGEGLVPPVFAGPAVSFDLNCKFSGKA